jgi:membrane-bound ClpP family serine protease
MTVKRDHVFIQESHPNSAFCLLKLIEMTDAFLIFFLLFVGVCLVVIEVIFVPGTTIVGILGVIVSVYAVYYTFVNFGNTTGFLVAIGGGLLNVAVLIWAFKTRAWERFSLKTAIRSKVNEDQENALKVGQEGETVSALRPIGKALFGEKAYEVTTGSNFLDSGKKVKIVRITNHKIIVEPISK